MEGKPNLNVFSNTHIGTPIRNKYFEFFFYFLKNWRKKLKNFQDSINKNFADGGK